MKSPPPPMIPPVRKGSVMAVIAMILRHYYRKRLFTGIADGFRTYDVLSK